ncbi:MAG: STAS domain-containing protein [Phycisphaerae bacterium]|nr:STAS domain-containing protein [Phycisphaerae bacterium]
MEVKTIDGVKVAVMGERFDACSADEVQTAINALIESGADRILFDFSRTEYMASVGFRIMLTAAKQLTNLGGGMVLCSLKPLVNEVFQTTGFDRVFDICDTEQRAILHLMRERCDSA